MTRFGPQAELAVGQQDVDVVGADEVLRHAHDGAAERGLAVVVGGVLGDCTVCINQL